MIKVKRISPVFQKIFMRWALTLTFAAWALTETYDRFHRPDPIFIFMDEDGTPSVLQDSEESRVERENRQKMTFAKTFVANYYQYTAATFDKNVGKASNMLGSELLKREMPKVVDVRNTVLADPTYVQKIKSWKGIEEPRPNQFIAEFDLSSRQGMIERTGPYRVTFNISRNDETVRNPWAFKITSLDDAVLRDLSTSSTSDSK